jgi:hypothetical protein
MPRPCVGMVVLKPCRGDAGDVNVRHLATCDNQTSDWPCL